jgi:glycosyltransferase involved in cell wall biosynthesis
MTERKIKLLFIITDYGSFNNFLSELTYSLIQENLFEIHVLCSSQKVINFQDKFDYTKIGVNFSFVDIPRSNNIFKQLRSSYKIQKIINFIKPDLIHAHFTTGIFTTLLLKFSKYEVWGTFHGLGFVVSNGYKKVFFFLIELFCFLKLNKIILITKDDYLKIPNFLKHKSILQQSKGLGCNLFQFNPHNHFVPILDDTLTIGFTGRFVNFKGFDIVIKTFLNLINSKKIKLKLILIGGKDSLHPTGLNEDENKLLYEHNDIIHVGFTKDVSKYLSLIDVFFFPSRKEGIPISIIEALAMEIPVLTLNSRGCKDLITDGFNGYCMEQSLPNEKLISQFSEKICYLADNKEILLKLKENIKRNKEQYDRNNFIKEQQKWYYDKLIIK